METLRLKLSEFVPRFKELFAGREDAYALALPKAGDASKVYYKSMDAPVTDEVIVEHLTGRHPIALYQIKDNKVKWMAMDVDGDGFEQAQHIAQLAKEKLEAAGLHTYLERSRSGTGIHLWVFLQDWIPADVAQSVMYGILDLPRELYDKIYPVQSSVSEGNYGSHLAMPFNGSVAPQGNSMFITDDGDVIPAAEFFATVRKNNPAMVQQLTAKYPIRSRRYSEGGTTTSVRMAREALLDGALKLISPFGCKFMRNAWINRATLKEPLWYVAIQQATAFKYGRDFAHLLSRDYSGYSESEVDAKFDQALRNPPMSCSTLRDKYPDLACENCTCKFPYEMGQKSLVELVRGAGERMNPLGTFDKDLELIRDLNEGKARSGYPLGIEGSENLCLLRPNELTIIGGLPSIGKSWLLTAGVLGQAKSGIIPLAFSPETAEISLRQRMLAHIAQVELVALRGERNPGLTTQEFRRLEEAARTLSQLQVFVDYATLSSEELLRQVEQTILSNRIPLDSPYVIWFDYLQFGFREPGEDDRERISRMAGEFKIVAKLLEHPVVALSQLTRTSEGDDKPDMTWFAGSSSIERNMDSGIIVTGERIFGDHAQRTLTQVKQREGRANSQMTYILQQGYGDWRPTGGAGRPELRNLLEMENQ